MNVLSSVSKDLVMPHIIAIWADAIPDWLILCALFIPIIAIIGVIYGLNLMFRGAREAQEDDSIEHLENNQGSNEIDE